MVLVALAVTVVMDMIIEVGDGADWGSCGAGGAGGGDVMKSGQWTDSLRSSDPGSTVSQYLIRSHTFIMLHTSLCLLTIAVVF